MACLKRVMPAQNDSFRCGIRAPIHQSFIHSFLHGGRNCYTSSQGTDGFLCSNLILGVLDNEPVLVVLFNRV